MLTCIVLDDDPDSLELATRCLAQLGLEIVAIEFLSGFTALEFLRRRRVDFILTDLRMPEMDGLTFIEEVRQFDKNTPIIATSSDESMSSEAIGCGANAFIPKDALDSAIIQAIETVLGEVAHRERSTEN